MKELDRRTFLKFAGRATIGTIVGNLTPYAANKVDQSTQRLTGIRSGNSAYFRYQERCNNNSNLDECRTNPNKLQEIIAHSLTSIFEESLFRAAPSALLSSIENPRYASSDTLFGTGSSIVFGAAHNLTENGFDKKTVPTSQILSGGILWYLQRKFGFVANTVAHTWHNLQS